MQITGEATSKTDYKYYPIKYPTKQLSAAAAFNCEADSATSISIIPIDESKILCYLGWRIDGDTEEVSVISVGF